MGWFDWSHQSAGSASHEETALRTLKETEDSHQSHPSNEGDVTPSHIAPKLQRAVSLAEQRLQQKLREAIQLVEQQSTVKNGPQNSSTKTIDDDGITVELDQLSSFQDSIREELLEAEGSWREEEPVLIDASSTTKGEMANLQQRYPLVFTAQQLQSWDGIEYGEGKRLSSGNIKWVPQSSTGGVFGDGYAGSEQRHGLAMTLSTDMLAASMYAKDATQQQQHSE